MGRNRQPAADRLARPLAILCGAAALATGALLKLSQAR